MNRLLSTAGAVVITALATALIFALTTGSGGVGPAGAADENAAGPSTAKLLRLVNSNQRRVVASLKRTKNARKEIAANKNAIAGVSTTQGSQGTMGPAGPQGPAGSAGPQGSRGPSDAYHRRRNTNVALVPGTTVLSLTLPAGAYVVSATTNITSAAGSIATCGIAGGGESIDAEDSIPVGGKATVAIEHAFTSPNQTTLRLLCVGGDFAIDAAMSATRVDKLTVEPLV